MSESEEENKEISTNEEDIEREYPSLSPQEREKVKANREMVKNLRKKNEITVTLEKPSDKELEKENKELKTVISKIADVEFNREVERVSSALGIDSSEITSPEELKAYNEILQKKRAEGTSHIEHSTVPLSASQVTGYSGYRDRSIPIQDRTYSSLEEMLIDIEEESKDAQSPHKNEADILLGQLASKGLKAGGTFEFQGELTKAIARRRFDKEHSEEEKLSEEMRALERRKWKRRD